jgi:8-oxo-dGTP pyrophosphatase MutT (NUDIX family)
MPASPTPPLYSLDDICARAQARMSLTLPSDIWQQSLMPTQGDHFLAPEILTHAAHHKSRPAAVLIALREDQGEAQIILTRRASHLRHHSGQIAFPGGKIDENDESPMAAAMREAHEEIGLDPHHVKPLGYLDPWQTITGYRIVPTLAVLTSPINLTRNSSEVDDIFEVPASFALDPRNHAIHSRAQSGKSRRFYAIHYREHYIWGATAGILRLLYARLYAP